MCLPRNFTFFLRGGQTFFPPPYFKCLLTHGTWCVFKYACKHTLTRRTRGCQTSMAKQGKSICQIRQKTFFTHPERAYMKSTVVLADHDTRGRKKNIDFVRQMSELNACTRELNPIFPHCWFLKSGKKSINWRRSAGEAARLSFDHRIQQNWKGIKLSCKTCQMGKSAIFFMICVDRKQELVEWQVVF